MYRRIYLIKV